MTPNNKIQAAFANGAAFIPFITCGDPDLETTKAIVRAMAGAGADLIELGIPFSDPTAEGPVIQEANVRALSAGVTTDKIFDMVRELRHPNSSSSSSDASAPVTVPMVFMTYANVVFSYGTERFVANAAEAGINGIILPDVPFEEKNDFAGAFREHGMSLISMIAPTSESRITEIATGAEGFVYCVSSLGVTGVRQNITTDIGAMTKLVRQANSNVPCAVGFGISTPEQAAKISQTPNVNGVIVGSAIVKIIAQHGRDSVKPVAEYVRSMKAAIAPIPVTA